jgi:microsomal epoxide hydrolase
MASRKPPGRVSPARRGGQLPGNLIRSVRPHAERFSTIVHWTELPRGGHFPAKEAPDSFVEDVRAFARPLR